MPGQELKSRLKRKRVAQATEVNKQSPQLGKRQGLHTCKYCAKDISQVVRIKCAVCPSFQLCLDCFCVGAEIQPHKNYHAYQVHGDLSFPLYDLEWGADEEMLLLEGIDKSGLGNWTAVSTHVGTKSASECKDHYFEIYVRSPTFPLPHAKPEMQNVDPLKVALERQTARNVAAETRTPSESPAPQADVKQEGPTVEEVGDTGGLVGALRPSGTEDTAQVDQLSNAPAKLEALMELQPEAAAGSRDQASVGQAAKKLRQGKSESANEAKAEAASASHDQQQQQQLSTRGLPTARQAVEGQKTVATPAQGATGLLHEPNKVGGGQYEMTGFHVKRCEFEHEYDNDAELLISDMEHKPTDTPAEHAEKVKLVEVYNLRLTERERRRAFVVSHGLLDVKLTQAAERRQSPAEREIYAQMRVFARFQQPAEHESLVDGLLLERRLRARLQALKELRAAGVRTFSDAEEFEMEKRKRRAEGGRRLDRSLRYTARTGTDDSSVMSQAAMASMATSESGSRVRELSRLRTNSAAPPSAMPVFGTEVGNTAAQLAAWRSRRGMALDITALPGTESLTSKERALCAGLRLLPSQYLAYKASLLREAQRRGGSYPRSEAKTLFRLESSTALRVYDLLVSCRWLMQAEVLDTGDAPPQPEGFSMNEAANNPSPANSGMQG